MTLVVMRDEWTIHDWVDWVQGHLDDQWQLVWEGQLPRLTRIYESEGKAAYGLYSRRTVRTGARRVGRRRDFVPAGAARHLPAFRGALGVLACRERRLWSVLQDREGQALGAIVTRFFHDHTRLRVPKVPIVFAVDGSDVKQVRRHALAGTGPLR